MKYGINFVAMIVFLASLNAKADQISSLTVDVCDQVSNWEIAADMLNQIGAGLDEQIQNSCPVKEQFVRFAKFERDITSPRIKVLESRLKSVEQLRDEEGLMNLVVVTYEVLTESKEVKQGQFSFSRYNSNRRIQKRGCAFVQKSASLGFIHSQCSQ